MDAPAMAGTISALHNAQTEGSLDFPSGRADLLRYEWAQDTADVWTSDRYFFHLCLTPRPGAARAVYLDADRRVAEQVGRLMFVPPGRTIRSGGAKGAQRSLHCSIRAEVINDLLPAEPVWSDAALAEGLHLRSPEIDWFLLKMLEELRQPGFAAPVLAESLAQGLAVAVIRKFRLHEGQAQAKTGGLSQARMRRIRERVEAEQPAPQLGELAALCDMSVRHLTRAFKAETGMTIARFVEHATIERARAMLGAGDRSIGEIAQCLGFSNSGSFAHAFRRATGIRPSEVRQGAAPTGR